MGSTTISSLAGVGGSNGVGSGVGLGMGADVASGALPTGAAAGPQAVRKSPGMTASKNLIGIH
jgi:hypothetical protein